MRIAHVATSISLNQIVLNQMVHQLERGHEVFALCPEDEWTERLKRHGIAVIDVPFERHRLFATFIAAFVLWRICRREGYDVVHTHNAMPGITGRIAARLSGVPVVLHTWHSWPLRLRRHPAYVWGFKVLEPLATRAAHAVLFLNPDDLQTWSELRGTMPEKAILVGNGINVDEFAGRVQADARSRVRREIGIGENVFLLAKVARFEHPRKGHHFFLEALRELRHRANAEVMALLIGGGKDEAYIRSEVERLGLREAVHFTGYREDVPDLLAAADVGVLTSPFEGIPRALMESMAVALPVVGSDVPGTRTLVRSGETGLLVDFGDVKGLVEALQRLIEDPALLSRLAEAGRERVKAEFDEPVVADRVLEIYHGLLEGRARDLPRWEFQD
jgi:glycosyltransferase involved in cell wall biosynthesis